MSKIPTIIYRVIDSPTEFEYAVADVGGYNYYGSLKRARLFHGDLPVEPISRADFNLIDLD